MLESVCGVGMVKMFQPTEVVSAPESLPSPGVGIRHYAPRARLVLVSDVSRSHSPVELGLVSAIDEVSEGDMKVGAMLPDGWDASYAALVYRWGPWDDGKTLARRLLAGVGGVVEGGGLGVFCSGGGGGGVGGGVPGWVGGAARGGGGGRTG